MDEEDTDTLLALIASSLNSNASFTQDEMMEALVNAGGNVEQATRWLKKLNMEAANGSSVHPSKRQKLYHTLDGWLGEAKPRSPPKRASSGHESPNLASAIELPTRQSLLDEKSHISPKIDPPPLLSILRAPSSSKKKPVLPPLLLGTPVLVARHTPTTLHYSILPNGMFEDILLA